MYQLIYDFISTHLFNGLDLDSMNSEVLGQTITLNEWLSHTMTITSIILIFVFLVLFIKWIFRVVSGLFLLK